MIANMKFSNLFSCFSATRTESTRTASANQTGNTAPQTSSSAALPVPSASDRDISARKSKKERSGFLALLRREKNNRAKSKTALADGKWHVQSPWVTQNGNVTLNAKIFEESILNSIQMDASDNRDWATRTKDMNNALAKLEMLKPDQFGSLSARGKAAVVDIFHNISRDIRDQQLRIGEILGEKETASSSSEIHEENTIAGGIKEAKEALDAIGKQVGILLFPMLSIAERLRELAHHMRELDFAHEKIEKSNEKEFLDSLKGDLKNKRRVKTPAKVTSAAISEAISNTLERSVLAVQIRTKLQKAFVQAELGKLHLSDAGEHTIRKKELMAQYKKQIEVSSFIDLSNEAEMAGIDLFDALTSDEFTFLTESMEKEKSGSNSSQTDEKTDIRLEMDKAEKATIKKLEFLGNQAGNNWGKKLFNQNEEREKVSKQITGLFSEAAKTEIDLSNELSTDEIVYLTRAMGAVGANKLARQTADLLHEPQLQDLLSRLNKQETHLDQLINHSLQPGSTEAFSEGAINIHDALKRIDASELSRLCNHNEVKGQKAQSHINGQLGRIGEKLHKAILHALDAPETSTISLTDEDRRQLNQAAKFLEYAQAKVEDLLQGKLEIKATAPSSQR